MRFEQLLHETIDEMSGEMTGPSTGLAARSMARGRRIRWARRAATAAGAVAAVVAVVLPWAVLSRPDGAAPRPVPAASTSPAPSDSAAPSSSPALRTAAQLPGGWVVTAVGDQVLDRATGEYVTMQKPVLAAPAGDRILVMDGPESLRLTSVRGADPVTVDAGGLIGDYNWSPTGDRLVGGITQKEPFHVGFAVIDARTGVVREHWIDHDRYDCSRCGFTWTRDGRQVVMTIADRSGGEAEERVSGLQLFDAETGEPTQSLPGVTAMPAGPFAWSPGGHYVLCGPLGTSMDWRLFDLTTGQSRPFPRPAVWVTADLLLAEKDGQVLTLTPDGTTTATIEPGVPERGTISFGPPR